MADLPAMVAQLPKSSGQLGEGLPETWKLPELPASIPPAPSSEDSSRDLMNVGLISNQNSTP